MKRLPGLRCERCGDPYEVHPTKIEKSVLGESEGETYQVNEKCEGRQKTLAESFK